jgi:hypothetical protein
VGVQAGWNHAGFFGPQPITLGASFPDDGSPISKISAIYHLDEATGTYSHWLAGTNAGRTLDTLQAGEAYWFLAAQPFILTGGFALNVPLPVQLKSGWNDFVYIGASADVRDALYSVTGKYDELYRWVNEGAGERWTTFGSATTPDWAREFTTMQACTVYQVHMNADATLTPLQPRYSAGQWYTPPPDPRAQEVHDDRRNSRLPRPRGTEGLRAHRQLRLRRQRFGERRRRA